HLVRHPLRTALARRGPPIGNRSRDDQPARGTRLIPGAGAMPDAPHILLAFDFGTRRIGVASGDTLTGTARALTALQCTPNIPWPQIDRLVEEYRPRQFVVGLPYNMGGTPTVLTEASRRFAIELK